MMSDLKSVKLILFFLIGNDKLRYIMDLRHKCDYSIHIVLEKSIILFDEALRRFERINKR